MPFREHRGARGNENFLEVPHGLGVEERRRTWAAIHEEFETGKDYARDSIFVDILGSARDRTED